ncbi:histidine--tRNA ligase [Noviherbaspirillum sp. Root189]|uniref:histidine--tRNA ligase n=1 Tax=Noviherbaspirillum sp. Root189 TaxID=1736487 RepID=UPI00070B9A95|nr:histidine--tRNA ligase [Noviherbaspirillum sp. Root189]KRB84487.1 histidine--tRNA ligase [Noviherbaspirillum sp. Root189]
MSENKKAEKIVGVKGMNDILPSDAALWELFENTVQSVLKSYGFQQIRTPIVEPTALFARGLGAVTDIVEKEMYSFVDSMNGDHLTLRPESTAGVVRAALEHNLTYDGPKRLWYMGPMFRHEKPQRGRYRQFHQVGAEALGFTGPDVDAELIMLCQRLWDDLGLQDIRLELNSIGNADERSRHRADLVAYFEQHKELLDTDAQRRLQSNPLRILDTKNPTMQQMVNAAPKLLDYLGEESRAHFEGVQKILRHNNIPFTINPRLVRGMDYYNRTVFEWVTDQLGSQGTVCGGGRYDPLIEMFGGKPTPACGFAIGVERLLELLKANGEQYVPNQCDVYVVHQGEAAQLQAFVVAERLRDAGLDVILNCASSSGGSSFKSQMKRADASGAGYAVIIGDDEVAQGVAAVKNLRAEEADNNQVTVPLESVAAHVLDQIVCGDGCDDPTHHHHH